MSDGLPLKGVCLGSRDLFKFLEISDNISETVQKIETWLQWKSNRKSYVANRMAPQPIPLNDLLLFEALLTPIPRET